MPHDCPALDPILEGLDSDSLWKEDNAIERGYLKAGLVRYLFHKLGSVLTHASVNRHQDVIQSNSDSKQSSKAFNSEPKTKVAKIKLENPSYQKLVDKTKILKSAKTRLEKELGASEDLLARMVARNKTGGHTEIVEKVEECQGKLSAFLKELRQHIAEVGVLTISDEIQPDTIGQMLQIIESCKAHQTGIVAQNAMMKDILGK
jgi:hypothetical protein